MLTIYLIALGFGGTLLLASMLLGGQDASADHGDGGEVHTEAAEGGEAIWTVARSVRFWTFLFAFGGAVGAVLTGLDAAGTVATAVIAGLAGVAAGTVATTVMRAVSGAASSMVEAAELTGVSGVVVVAIERGQLGKVRVEAKGRAVDLLAATDDAAALPTGTEILVIGGGDDGRVQVTRAPTD
ncbi:MAG: hypothetical protein IPL61_15785 [Myxococcales bacterium]|nr:hypothetical protein [Myxococcales bacterium]